MSADCCRCPAEGGAGKSRVLARVLKDLLPVLLLLLSAIGAHLFNELLLNALLSRQRSLRHTQPKIWFELRLSIGIGFRC
jgi:hypothetical protein